MGRRTFKKVSKESDANANDRGLATGKPVAVYYRQSTDAQVGNISTAIQTVDMVAELKQRGWDEDNIILIDVDEGISGMTKIDERPGMSQLFELITDGKIGTVACQDEDRLFRDVTQIQVNIFIEACRKTNVQVLTPFFTYDFGHPLHGTHHARQFRFKSDMAAEYIHSYVQGRLASARVRLIKQGLWAGAATPVGFMVDMRRTLPDGSENPNYRKYVPFEPHARMVRRYYEICIELGGNVRGTITRVHDEGLYIPECELPKGFKVNSALKQRTIGSYVNRNNMVLLLTNPAYIGHWSYKGEIIRWDNHESIIDLESYMKVFNRLSKYTLTGEPNPYYAPRTRYIRKHSGKDRKAARPLLSGLIVSDINGKHQKAYAVFSQRRSRYMYHLDTRNFKGSHTIWARQARWIDEPVVNVFKSKLAATFQPDVWQQTVESAGDRIAQETKLRKAQLLALEEATSNVVKSIERLSNPALVGEVEVRYEEMISEKQRLLDDIDMLENQKHEQIGIQQMQGMFEDAVARWGEMPTEEQQRILATFIERIEATDYDRAGNMRLTIFWRDDSRDEIQLMHKPHNDYWTLARIQKLIQMVDNNESQLKVAEMFREMKWVQIYGEIKRHRPRFRFSRVYLRKSETYNEYVARGGSKGKASPSLWRTDEDEVLRKMVEDGCTQEDIMKQYPFRRWIQIQYRIKGMFGTGTRIPRNGVNIPQRLTYTEYLEQTKKSTEEDSEESEQQQITTVHDPDSGSVEKSFLWRIEHVLYSRVQRNQVIRRWRNWAEPRAG